MRPVGSDILIVTTDTIDGETCRPIAPILVACCLSKSLLGDMAANVKNWTTGGELQGYSDMLEQTGNLVLRRLAEKARAGGADAVGSLECNRRPLELIGYGKAVRVVD